jgi:hypothetical protein
MRGNSRLQTMTTFIRPERKVSPSRTVEENFDIAKLIEYILAFRLALISILKVARLFVSSEKKEKIDALIEFLNWIKAKKKIGSFDNL